MMGLPELSGVGDRLLSLAHKLHGGVCQEVVLQTIPLQSIKVFNGGVAF